MSRFVFHDMGGQPERSNRNEQGREQFGNGTELQSIFGDKFVRQDIIEGPHYEDETDREPTRQTKMSDLHF